MLTKESIFIESNDSSGSPGAKGLAEHALIPVVPVIANAVFHATEKRLTAFTLTPGKVTDNALSPYEHYRKETTHGRGTLR